MTYVLYQHWGNLSPDALEEEEIYQAGQGRRATAASWLRDLRSTSATARSRARAGATAANRLQGAS